MYVHRAFGKRPYGGISRRRFVRGLMTGAVIAGLDLWRWPALAMSTRNEQAVLSGEHFDLAIDEVAVNFTGRASVATAINGSVPSPLLRWREPGSGFPAPMAFPR
jgi:FtsP/CotA-like multicopper oxidase with cupredoxin domain